MAAQPGVPAPRRATGRGAAATWLFAGLMWLALEGISAAAFPGYSYARNYISDLGIPLARDGQGRGFGSPRYELMNANFIAHGLLFLLAAALLARAGAGRARRAFLGLAGVYAAGSLLVGLFHSAAQGTTSGASRLHLVGAGMAILGGNAAIIVLGTNARRLGLPGGYGIASVVTGALGIACVVALQAGPPLGLPGLWERGSVYTITAWELATGVVLLVTTRHHGIAGEE